MYGRTAGVAAGLPPALAFTGPALTVSQGVLIGVGMLVVGLAAYRLLPRKQQ